MAQIKIPVSTIDQLVARMETVYADRVAMRYYDEAAGTVREVLYRDYAAGPITPCADRDALMAILFTSGTTGHSKGVEFRAEPFPRNATGKQIRVP